MWRGAGFSFDCEGFAGPFGVGFGAAPLCARTGGAHASSAQSESRATRAHARPFSEAVGVFGMGLFVTKDSFKGKTRAMLRRRGLKGKREP